MFQTCSYKVILNRELFNPADYVKVDFNKAIEVLYPVIVYF